VRYAFASNLEGYGQFSYSTKEQRTNHSAGAAFRPVRAAAQPPAIQRGAVLDVPAASIRSCFRGRVAPTQALLSDAFVQAQTGGKHAGPADPLPVRDHRHRDISDISDQTRVVLGLKR